MELPALHGKRLGAAVTFVAATLVLAVQLISPSPVVVSIGENGARTTQLGQYFTTLDVGIIAISATVLGASGTYLLLPRQPRTDASGSPARRAIAGSDRTGQPDRPPRTMADGALDVDPVTRTERSTDPAEWERTLERLRGNEEMVYAQVVDADGELPQREIVRGTDLSKATVSRTLDTLESKGLLERKRRGMGNVVVLQ